MTRTQEPVVPGSADGGGGTGRMASELFQVTGQRLKHRLCSHCISPCLQTSALSSPQLGGCCPSQRSHLTVKPQAGMMPAPKAMLQRIFPLETMNVCQRHPGCWPAWMPRRVCVQDRRELGTCNVCCPGSVPAVQVLGVFFPDGSGIKSLALPPAESWESFSGGSLEGS